MDSEDLEYLVRIPTRMGVVSTLFGNNGVVMYTVLEVNQEDKSSFELLGWKSDELPLIDITSIDGLENAISNLTTEIEFYDIPNHRRQLYDIPENLQDMATDTWASLAISNSSDLLNEITSKLQEHINLSSDINKKSKYNSYIATSIGVVGFAIFATGFFIPPSIEDYATWTGISMLIGSGLYSWKGPKNKNKSYQNQKINTIYSCLSIVSQQIETVQTSIAKSMTLKETLLGTGWFPLSYGK